MAHLKCFSESLWLLIIWRSSFRTVGNISPQSPHFSVFGRWCSFMWVFRLYMVVNFLPQSTTWHWNNIEKLVCNWFINKFALITQKKHPWAIYAVKMSHDTNHKIFFLLMWFQVPFQFIPWYEGPVTARYVTLQIKIKVITSEPSGASDFHKHKSII